MARAAKSDLALWNGLLMRGKITKAEYIDLYRGRLDIRGGALHRWDAPWSFWEMQSKSFVRWIR